jgi:hypothetical protein
VDSATLSRYSSALFPELLTHDPHPASMWLPLSLIHTSPHPFIHSVELGVTGGREAVKGGVAGVGCGDGRARKRCLVFLRLGVFAAHPDWVSNGLRLMHCSEQRVMYAAASLSISVAWVAWTLAPGQGRGIG